MRHTLTVISLSALLTACGAPPQKQADAAPAAQPPAAKPASAPAPAAPDPLAAMVDKINQAVFDPAAATAAAATPATAPVKGAPLQIDPLAIRTEVLLGRARFSPGVVDSRLGTNLKHAISAYQNAHGMDETGTMDAATWQALVGEAGSAPPAAKIYTIAPEDVAGPFAADVGEDFVKLAALPDGPQFTTPLEALAERFHMSQALLTALNPGVDLTKAGERIIVVDETATPFAKGDVARVDVSNADASAFAYDAGGKLIAFYPATVGSTERPSPSGEHKVVGVARHPTYTYDPSKLKWGPRSAGKLVVKAGPNNPVGAVWIDLNAPSYGIHGTPEPDQIGKTASHGCVRLTNWDAEALAGGVKPGVLVSFIGTRAKTAKSAKKKA